MLETFKGHWIPPVEWVEEKASKLHTQQVPSEDLLPCIAYFHLFLLPFLILWPLSPAASSVFWYRSCLVVLDLHMKYTLEVVPLRTYIVWFVIM